MGSELGWLGRKIKVLKLTFLMCVGMLRKGIGLEKKIKNKKGIGYWIKFGFGVFFKKKSEGLNLREKGC